MTTPASYAILVDTNGKPVPQYFVPGTGFKPLLGTEDVAPHYILVDESGTIQEDFFTNATFTGRVGEVQDTPTAYTLLARLKELEDKLDAIKDTDGIKKIEDTVSTELTGSSVELDVNLVSALPAGANTIGNVKMFSNLLAEQQDESDGTTLTFSDDIEVIEIYNTDGSNDGVFEVNGIEITVPAGEAFMSAVAGTIGNVVNVSGATTSYIVSRYIRQVI